MLIVYIQVEIVYIQIKYTYTHMRTHIRAHRARARQKLESETRLWMLVAASLWGRVTPKSPARTASPMQKMSDKPASAKR